MARSLATVVLSLVYLSVNVSARDAGVVHVRSLDAWAAESLQRGRDGSALVRQLLNGLAASDVIVHLESTEVMPTAVAGMTRFVAAVGEYRYVRITLDRRLDPHARAATLAHELQHACELARSHARSRLDLEHLFETIGYRISRNRRFYETNAAERAGLQAWAELRGYSSATRDGQQ
jgi:hypothetical protein